MKWIIDTDYSTNSQIAIDLLIKNKLDIIAITTVHGLESKHTKQIKAEIEKDLKEKYKIEIPVYAGASEGYVNYQEELGDEPIRDSYNNIDNSNSNNDIEKFEAYNNQPNDINEIASLQINNLINKHKKNLSILTLSALTNLSLAVLLDNTIVDKFDKLIIIGGSSTGKGNSGNFSETNFRCDPIAAKNVVLYYKNILLLPLDIEIEFIKNHYNKDFKKEEFLGLSHYIDSMLNSKKSILQILCVLFVLNNKVASKLECFSADVDIMGKYSRGSIALERYKWIETDDFNRIQFYDFLNIDEVRNTIKNIVI